AGNPGQPPLLTVLNHWNISMTHSTAVAADSIAPLRHDWSRDEALALFGLPFNDLLYRAQTVHRQHFDPNEVLLCTLLSIKTGACPEDCKYCPQSGLYDTGLEKEKLLA